MREPILESQVRDLDRLAGVIGRQARALAKLGLQLLEPQGSPVRGGDVRGASSGSIIVTPAAVIGMMSTIRLTS